MGSFEGLKIIVTFLQSSEALLADESNKSAYKSIYVRKVVTTLFEG